MPTQTISIQGPATITIVTPDPTPPPPPVLNIDDSHLAPAEAAAICVFPTWPIFNVQTYGAKGDGVADDTVAARAALAAIKKSGSPGIAYFPKGVYNVCNQTGDVAYGPIFDLSTFSNIAFVGDPAGTTIRGFMPGLINPVTGFGVISTTAYEKLGRFSMFRMIPNPGVNLSGIQFRSLIIDGQCPFTGNATVGGIVATGDGWDMTHKCIQMDGSGTVTNVLVFNCTLQNWRGEIVYGGGTACGILNIVASAINECNASAVSVSGNVTIIGGSIGPLVYNATECFAINGQQQLTIKGGADISSGGNGIVYIGVAAASLTISEGAKIHNCVGRGIMLSEMGTNISLNGVAFSGNQQDIITSILGLYPNNGPTGMDNVTINNCTSNDPFLVLQNPITNLSISNHTQNAGVFLDGQYMGTGCTISNLNLVGGTDIGFNEEFTANKALWTGTIHPFATESGAKYSLGYRVEDFSKASTGGINPTSDYTGLVANTATGPYTMTISPTGYPTGFQTTFKVINNSNWFLKSDPTWNTWAADLPIKDGTQIKFNGKTFDLVA